MGVCRNIGRGQDIVVCSGVEASGGVSSSRIRSALPSSILSVLHLFRPVGKVSAIGLVGYLPPRAPL